MRRGATVLLALAALLLLVACDSVPNAANRSDERLRLRVAAFYSAWSRRKVDIIDKLVSQNFHDNDPGLAAMKSLMEHNAIRPAQQITAIEDELQLKRVTVNLTKDNGQTFSQISYWKYERGDWYLEVLD
jgi:hypothetical protein